MFYFTAARLTFHYSTTCCIVLQHVTLNVALSCVHKVEIQYCKKCCKFAIFLCKNIAVSIAIVFPQSIAIVSIVIALNVQYFLPVLLTTLAVELLA